MTMIETVNDAPLSVRLHLRFLDYRIAVVTDSVRLAARLEDYYAAYLSSPPAAPDITLRALYRQPRYDAERMHPWGSKAPANGRAIKESYYDDGSRRYILKNRTGILIELDGVAPTISGDIESNANQVINLIATLFGLSMIEQGYSMVHGSAVVQRADGRALVFLGNSGSGKSSVALQLLEHGQFDFLSNDRVLLRVLANGGIEVAGLPKQPRVNPGTLLASEKLVRLLPRIRRQMYARLPASELWTFEEKRDVDVTRDLGRASMLLSMLERLYALDWREAGDEFVIRGLDAEGALNALRHTAKDFGPYQLGAARDATLGFAAIADVAPASVITGRRDPTALARSLIAR